MITTRWLVGVAAAVWLAAGDSGWAQNTLDAQAVKLYGGTYSVDCSNPTATRLRVVADALMVEQGISALPATTFRPRTPISVNRRRRITW